MISVETFSSIDTPAILLDYEQLVDNIRTIQKTADDNGAVVRPHIKTHKSLEVARIQLEAGARGLTVATLREAEVMATLTNDLLLAYPPVGDAKLERLVRLPMSLDLKVALDSSDVLVREVHEPQVVLRVRTDPVEVV